MCNREEYFDDGFNEITVSNTDKMLKAITTISNNQKELEQKLEQRQRTAYKNEPSEQGPVNIFNCNLLDSKKFKSEISQICPYP